MSIEQESKETSEIDRTDWFTFVHERITPHITSKALPKQAGWYLLDQELYEVCDALKTPEFVERILSLAEDPAIGARHARYLVETARKAYDVSSYSYREDVRVPRIFHKSIPRFSVDTFLDLTKRIYHECGKEVGKHFQWDYVSVVESGVTPEQLYVIVSDAVKAGGRRFAVTFIRQLSSAMTKEISPEDALEYSLQFSRSIKGEGMPRGMLVTSFIKGLPSPGSDISLAEYGRLAQEILYRFDPNAAGNILEGMDGCRFFSEKEYPYTQYLADVNALDTNRKNRWKKAVRWFSYGFMGLTHAESAVHLLSEGRYRWYEPERQKRIAQTVDPLITPHRYKEMFGLILDTYGTTAAVAYAHLTKNLFNGDVEVNALSFANFSRRLEELYAAVSHRVFTTLLWDLPTLTRSFEVADTIIGQMIAIAKEEKGKAEAILLRRLAYSQGFALKHKSGVDRLLDPRDCRRYDDIIHDPGYIEQVWGMGVSDDDGIPSDEIPF
jgi:hypothetical protein